MTQRERDLEIKGHLSFLRANLKPGFALLCCLAFLTITKIRLPSKARSVVLESIGANLEVHRNFITAPDCVFSHFDKIRRTTRMKSSTSSGWRAYIFPNDSIKPFPYRAPENEYGSQAAFTNIKNSSFPLNTPGRFDANSLTSG